MVEKAFEHLVYHAEMIVVALELPFEVDEVGGRGMETLGEEPGNAIGDLRMRPQESGGVLERVDRRAGCRAHRRRVGLGEEARHLAEYGSGCIDDRNHCVAPRHFDGALFQDVEAAGSRAFDEKDGSRLQAQ